MKIKTALTALILTASTMASASTTFSISTKSIITWKEKVPCENVQACMVDLRTIKKDGFKVALKVGKKKSYVTVSHKYNCDDKCLADVEAFINAKNYMQD